MVWKLGTLRVTNFDNSLIISGDKSGCIFESAYVFAQGLNLCRRQLLPKGWHYAWTGFDGVDDLGIRSACLPFGVGQVLRSHQSAMKGMRTPILTMANNAVFLKQTTGIHLVGRITRLLLGQRTEAQPGASIKSAGNRSKPAVAVRLFIILSLKQYYRLIPNNSLTATGIYGVVHIGEPVCNLLGTPRG